MIPGYGASKIRVETVATTTAITVQGDLIRLTGSTQVDTITCPNMLGRDGVLIMVTPVDGNVVVGTTGNVLVGQTLVENRLYLMAYAAQAAKWYIHAVA